MTKVKINKYKEMTVYENTSSIKPAPKKKHTYRCVDSSGHVLLTLESNKEYAEALKVAKSMHSNIKNLIEI